MFSRQFMKICNYFPIKICSKLARGMQMMTTRCSQNPSIKKSLMAINAFSVLRPVFGVVLPFSFVLHSASKKDEKLVDEHKIIKVADELYDAAKYEDLYTLLYAERESENEEILWRLARALFEKCHSLPDKEKLEMLEEAYGYVKKALDINDNCSPAHKWWAILADFVWRLKSTKGRILNSFDARKHIEKALELDPKDSTSYYMLGEWCYSFADMSWYQRKAASVIFTSPPTSTFEEALHFYQEAEKISPHFYSLNLLMIGKCFLKLNEVEKAKHYLLEARDFPVVTADDKQAHKEAVILLKGLGINDS